MRIGVSRRTAAVIATVVIVVFGLWFFLVPARPKVAAAGPESGIAAACNPGSRTGHADLNDNLQTSDRLTIAVRTPSNYDPTRAYPLLVVYPPAGFNRRQSETFYDLTTEATRRGFIVAYSDHKALSPTAVSQQAKVAATVASFFCVDEASISLSRSLRWWLHGRGYPRLRPQSQRRATQHCRERRGDHERRPWLDGVSVNPGCFDRPQPRR
jgi:polyhydroxybutyrate depolymerase